MLGDARPAYYRMEHIMLKTGGKLHVVLSATKPHKACGTV
jgi:hypothetical protein